MLFEDFHSEKLPRQRVDAEGSSQSQSARSWLSTEAVLGTLPAELLAAGHYQWHQGAQEGFGERQQGIVEELSPSIHSSLPDTCGTCSWLQLSAVLSVRFACRLPCLVVLLLNLNIYSG